MAEETHHVPTTDQERNVIAWIKEALEEGEAFLKCQKGYNKISDAVDYVMGDTPEMRHSSSAELPPTTSPRSPPTSPA